MERDGRMLEEVMRLCAGLFEPLVRGRETEAGLTSKGRMIGAGRLGTCTITVARGVFSLAVNSLRPSSESISVNLSKAGPFLDSGVVRSGGQMSVPNFILGRVDALPMNDVTSYWVPPESTFIRDMLPGLLPASSLLRPGESGIGVVGYSLRIGILGGSNPAATERRSSFLSKRPLEVDVGDGMPLAVDVKVMGGSGKLLNENSLRPEEGKPTEEFERLRSFGPFELVTPSIGPIGSPESRPGCWGDRRRKAAMLLSNSVCWRRRSVNDMALLRVVLLGVRRL